MNMPETTQSMVARFKDKSLDFKPGEKWNYSNSGYFLGVIIEKVSHESYESFYKRRSSHLQAFKHGIRSLCNYSSEQGNGLFT
jgi:hypothetical protein